MKRRKVDSRVERHLLTALITSRDFLGQAAPVLNLDLIEAPHFRTVAQWCLDYFQEYGEAPQKHIETLYHGWVESQDEVPSDASAVHDLLEELSDEYDNAGNLNVPFLLDELGDFIARRGLKRLSEDLEFSLHSGDTESAERSVLDYKTVEVGSGAGIDPLNDEAAWERAFSEPHKPLIEFPGDAGMFLNSALTRDALIAIQAPEKRGKTWWCIEFVMRALMERLKVAFFQVGDLTEPQVMLRLGMRLTNRPLRKKDCGTIQVPRKIKKPRKSEEDEEKQGLPRIVRKTLEIPKHVTKNECKNAAKKFMRRCGLSPKKTYIKVSVHSNSSVNVAGINSVLDRWRMQDDFIPDLIVIDYADILAPEDPKKQARDQINDTWKALRRLSQDWHSLVIVPTQADAASYDQDTQSMKNFSEDKRKMAHVTGMIGLNQTNDEKEMGVMRLNWIVLRESPFNTKQCLWVGQCLTLGKAFCCATL